MEDDLFPQEHRHTLPHHSRPAECISLLNEASPNSGGVGSSHISNRVQAFFTEFLTELQSTLLNDHWLRQEPLMPSRLVLLLLLKLILDGLLRPLDLIAQSDQHRNGDNGDIDQDQTPDREESKKESEGISQNMATRSLCVLRIAKTENLRDSLRKGGIADDQFVP